MRAFVTPHIPLLAYGMYRILWIYVLNQVLWLVNIVSPRFFVSPRPLRRPAQVTLDELGTGLAKSISAVLANKLLISVRRHYYGHEHELFDPTTNVSGTGMQFRSGRVPATTGNATTSGATFMFGYSGVAEPMFREDGSDEYEMRDFSEKTGF